MKSKRKTYQGDQFTTDVRRFNRQIASCREDLTLLILKGHLLVEEQLMALIEDLLKHSNILQAARLGFHQKVKMVKAIIGHTKTHSPNDPFKAIDYLNCDLRNHLTHRVEVTDLGERVDKFCDQMEKIFPQKQMIKDRSALLKSALQRLYLIVIAYRLAS